MNGTYTCNEACNSDENEYEFNNNYYCYANTYNKTYTEKSSNYPRLTENGTAVDKCTNLYYNSYLQCLPAKFCFYYRIDYQNNKKCLDECSSSEYIMPDGQCSKYCNDYIE